MEAFGNMQTWNIWKWENGICRKNWKNEINRYNLNWTLSPSVTDVEFDPVVFMKQKHNICFSPFQDPSINVNGEIAPCSRLQHLGLGNVFDNGFDNVWNGQKINHY